MDDDARNFATAKDVSNPLSFFVDPAVANNFSVTPTVNPMLGLSIWLDTRLAGRSVRFAQLHNVLILAATLCLMFLVLQRCGLSALGASVTCCLWLLLPATIVVSGWLAARHHLEGLTWSLGAVLVAQKLVGDEWREDRRSISLLVLLLGFAALFKETYAATVPLGLFLYLWHFRRKAAAASCVTLFLAYVAYRCWLVGVSVGGGFYDTLPNLAVFVQFLARLPYVFAANAGGYLLIVLAIWAAIRLCREGQVGWRVALSTLAVCAACLIVIYRGALPLYREWLDPGTWYRIVFLLETMLLVGSAYLFARMPNRRFGYIAALIAFPVLLCGGSVTERKWDSLSARYEIEGKYYLKHLDRLVYSEVPAGWFLDGIQHLYDLPDRHHVVAGHEQPELAQQLARYSTIWRYVDGKFVQDPELFRQLRASLENAPSAL